MWPVATSSRTQFEPVAVWVRRTVAAVASSVSDTVAAASSVRVTEPTQGGQGLVVRCASTESSAGPVSVRLRVSSAAAASPSPRRLRCRHTAHMRRD